MRGARRALIAVGLMVVLAAMAGCGGSGGSSKASEYSTGTLTQMHARSDQIGQDLLDQLGDTIESDSFVDSEAGSDDAGGNDSVESGPRHWGWLAYPTLTKQSGVKSTDAAASLAKHLVSQGWELGTPSPQSPYEIDLYKTDDLGDWWVSLGWFNPAAYPDLRGMVLEVQSPITTKN